MIMLLALPVIAAVALAHRYLLLYAPSNVLARRAHASRPNLRNVGNLLVLTAVLLITMKVTSDAVASGAPGWLNLIVLVLAWDAIKMWWLTIVVLIRRTAFAARRSNDRYAARPRARILGMSRA